LSSSNIIKRFDPSMIRRPQAYRGPRSSEDITDTFDELISDLTQISKQWNNGLMALLDSVPIGEEDSSVDAIANGLDARTLWVDSDVTSTSDPLTYYHSALSRPKTVKEALDDLYTYVDDTADTILAGIEGSSSSGALTADQKSAIGIHIFDVTQTSTASSLDGKSERSRLNLVQVAQDVYGGSYSLDDDGGANLTYSVKDMVHALLLAHGGVWNSDISLIHSGINLNQIDVAQSALYNDSFVGAPANLQEDLNQVRTRIKTYAGGATWTTAMPALYAAGPDSLRDLLNDTYGTGTKSATNPWGYNYTDIDGLVTALTKIETFVGQGSVSDDSPNYSSNDYVVDGTSLETSIGVLDDVMGWAATPAETRSSSYFRRMEVALIGSGATVTHNQSSFPDVKVIQISPSPLVSGELTYVVSHTSTNEFELRFVDRNDGVTPSGVVGSGIVLCTW